MLDTLSQRLARVVKTIKGEARLTEANTDAMLREIRIALLEADVALPVVREFISRVKEMPACKDNPEDQKLIFENEPVLRHFAGTKEEKLLLAALTRRWSASYTAN